MALKEKPRILLTRTKEDNAVISYDFERIGYLPISCPLIRIRSIKTEIPKGIYDACIFTSRHGVRAYDLSLPVFVSGAQTAEAAYQAGYKTIYSAQYGAAEIEGLLSQHNIQRALYFSGRHIAHNFLYPHHRIIVYDAELEEKTCEAVPEFDLACFYSARTARYFCNLMRNCQKNMDGVRFYCISEAVADILKQQGYYSVFAAKKPQHQALLQKVKEEEENHV